MEFNLSEKELELQNVHAEWSDVYYKKDIKEFIKRLKHALKHGIKGATHMSEPELIKNEWAIINKLAGDELI